MTLKICTKIRLFLRSLLSVDTIWSVYFGFFLDRGAVFSSAVDTLKALDVAFDSFGREFVLGKKRIIVPSSCIQTVVDPETGNLRKYFDADDEAYVALKCDEERDLKITDNTVELRIEEHVAAINALLNILCFQTGAFLGDFLL